MIAVSTVDVEELLLGLKIAFLVLLYLFIWRIVRTASKDLRLPQESFILDPEQAAALRKPDEFQTGELVVLQQNLTTSSMEALQVQGRAVRLTWRRSSNRHVEAPAGADEGSMDQEEEQV